MTFASSPVSSARQSCAKLLMINGGGAATPSAAAIALKVEPTRGREGTRGKWPTERERERDGNRVRKRTAHSTQHTAGNMRMGTVGRKVQTVASEKKRTRAEAQHATHSAVRIAEKRTEFILWRRSSGSLEHQAAARDGHAPRIARGAREREGGR